MSPRMTKYKNCHNRHRRREGQHSNAISLTYKRQKPADVTRIQCRRVDRNQHDDTNNNLIKYHSSKPTSQSSRSLQRKSSECRVSKTVQRSNERNIRVQNARDSFRWKPIGYSRLHDRHQQIQGHNIKPCRQSALSNSRKYRQEKLKCSSPKKIMSPVGTITGSYIELFPIEEHICLAEGIETSLAIHEFTDKPVISCLNAQNLSAVDLPDLVKKVDIWGDNDASYCGQRTAPSPTG